jgi:hypothetical protein
MLLRNFALSCHGKHYTHEHEKLDKQINSRKYQEITENTLKEQSRI